MTIKELAKELGVSPQAVYQRLKKKDVDVRKLVDFDTRELTTDGEYAIRKMFDRPGDDNKPTKQTMIEEYNKQIEELRSLNQDLQDKLRDCEARIRSLEKDKEFYQSTCEKAQSLQEQMLNRLLPGKAEQLPEKLTWKERFTGRVNRK